MKKILILSIIAIFTFSGCGSTTQITQTENSKYENIITKHLYDAHYTQ